MGRYLLESKTEERTVTYDVILAGLGGMGSAYGFAVRGRRVLGLERYRPRLADLAIDGSTRHPTDLFSPNRLAVRW
jgi:hypothetical protein